MGFYVKSVRKYGAAFLAALLLGSFVQSGGAEAGARIPSTIPNFGLYLTESFDLSIEPSNFWANADSADHSKMLRCESVTDEKCTNATSVKTIINLPTCAIDASFDCIKAVWAVDPAGKKIDGQFLNSLPVKGTTDRDAIPSMLLAAANGFGGLWKIPGVVNSGGEENYFVSLRIDSYMNKAVGVPLDQTKIYYGQFMAGITPVKAVAGNYFPMTSRPNWGPTGAPAYSGPSNTPQGERCTVVDTGVCQLPQDFPTGYRFGMSVQLAQKVSGWFHGRIALPQISVAQDGKGQLISIEAEPVKISTLDFTIPNAQIPESVRKVIFADVDWGLQGDVNGSSIKTMLNGLSDPLTMQIMNDMLPTIGDKATKTTQYWSYRALNTWQNPEIERCTISKDELGGVVTTNALTYSAGPPNFNKASGALEYKVASPHYEASGAEASGSYDLAINSKVARCIYGFSSAPIQAEISITTSAGEKKVATTVVNEKNGWLYLSAKGFTFSSPTINVKLSQEREVIATPAPTPTETPMAIATVAKKKVTISCVKGKTTKKVTAISPKCPAGFKKK
ncbi:MAG: hypothetical protein RL031_653 [Actinomycetota bacterium]|jgi:hypothetical protein